MPYLCDQFRRICRDCLSEKEQKDSHKTSVLALRQFKLDDDSENVTNQLEKLNDNIAKQQRIRKELDGVKDKVGDVGR